MRRHPPQDDAAIDGSDGWVVDSTLQRLVGDYVSGPAQLLVWLDLPLPLELLRASGRSLRRLWTNEHAHKTLRLRTVGEVDRWLARF